MPVNRTPKGRRAAVEPEYTGYFEAMERGSSEVDQGNNGPDLAAQIAALASRVDGLTAQNEDLQRANMVLSQQPPQQVYYADPDQGTPELLPDPVMDADGFTRGLVSRVDQMVARDLAANRDEQIAERQEIEAFNGLWNEFATHPDFAPWAEDHDKVEFATVKVGKRMQSRGVDINRYMFQYRDQFFADVAQELQNQFGNPEGEDAGSEEDTDTDRTEGLFGGQPAPVARPAAKEGKDMPDMLSDLAEIQRRTGYY